MTSRRRYLSLLAAGTVGLAGCGGNTSSSTPTDSRSRTTSTPTTTETGTEAGTEVEEEESGTPSAEERVEQQLRESIPLEGLGMYEERILEAETPGQATTEEIDAILEGDSDPETLRNGLDDIITTDNIHSVMKYFHQQHQDQENTVVANKNWRFTGQSDPTIEIYTVQNQELQSGPTITDTYNNQVNAINQPGSNTPEPLADLRNPEDASQNVAQDYQSVQTLIERGIDINDATEEEVREYRADKLQDWSRVMFGVDDEPLVRPKDVDTADTVFEAMYGDGNAQILADLSNEYASEDYDPDTLVEVEYDGSSWNFHTPTDTEMGDPLEGEEERFS